MRPLGRLGAATLLEVRGGETPRPGPVQRMTLELDEGNAPEVVSVRSQREQMGARPFSSRQMLERAPLVAGKPDWVVDLDEETGQTSDNGQEEHPERDPPGERAGTLRKLQAAIEQRVDQSDRDRSRREQEHGCSHCSDRVAGGIVAVGPEWLCQRIEGSPNEREREQRRDERAQP